MVENSMIPGIIIETDDMRIKRIVEEKLNTDSLKNENGKHNNNN